MIDDGVPSTPGTPGAPGSPTAPGQPAVPGSSGKPGMIVGPGAPGAPPEEIPIIVVGADGTNDTIFPAVTTTTAILTAQQANGIILDRFGSRQLQRAPLPGRPAGSSPATTGL